MTLVELANCSDTASAVPSSGASLTRVALFNLELALRLGHVNALSVKTVTDELVEWYQACAAVGYQPHVDQLYGVLAELLVKWGPKFGFERGNAITSLLDHRAVTYQPSHAFKYWLTDAIPEAAKPDHSIADVQLLSKKFNDGKYHRSGATIGNDPNPVWLTPAAGIVAASVKRANMLSSSGGTTELMAARLAVDLRRLLGLYKRQFPEFAVALTSKATIRELVERKGAVAPVAAKPVAAKPATAEDDDADDASLGLFAPTQFDARDYPRFRHWPVAPPQPYDDFGRTWALDGMAAYEPGELGAPEVVTMPMKLGDIHQVLPLGQITDRAFSPAQQKIADAKFADEFCGPVTILELLTGLEKRLYP